jgi:transposase
MTVSDILVPALPGDLQPEIRSLVTSLVERVAALEAALQAAQGRNQDLQAENQLLRQKVDALVRRVYGSPKNEAIDPKQLELLLAGLGPTNGAAAAPQTGQPETSKAPARAARRKPARSGIPDHLPIEEVRLVPEEVQAHPDQFRLLEEVVTIELDFQPGRFFVRHIIRGKYVRKPVPSQPLAQAPIAQPPVSQMLDSQTGVPVIAVATGLDPAAPEVREVLIAPLPNRLVERGLPGVGLLVYLLISRFEDHLPYYRLQKIFHHRHRVEITRQSMVDWTQKIVFWLTGIYLMIKSNLLKGNYLQADETPVSYLDRDCPGKSQKGYLWVYSRPGGDVLFEWKTSRGHAGPQEFLKGFGGRLQTDGYAVYQKIVHARARTPELAALLLYGCWAHARRQFFQARDEDRRAAWFLRQIGLLYDLERRVKEAGPNQRQAARAAEARMILARIGKALERVGTRVLPQSLLGKAIHYTQGLWTELNRYAEDGLVEIDNNAIENAIRPTAIGKKNWLFIGHPEAGQDSAVIYTILACCHRYAINPAEYLTDVLRHLPDLQQKDLASWIPSQWAKTHPQAKVIPIT